MSSSSARDIEEGSPNNDDDTLGSSVHDDDDSSSRRMTEADADEAFALRLQNKLNSSGGGESSTNNNQGGIEHIDENDTGPDHHPAAMFEDGKQKMGGKKIEIEDDDDDECPVPFNSADFEDGVEIQTLQGNTAKIAVDADGNVTINGAAITGDDIVSDNGIIHAIEAVILPPVE